MLLLLLARLCHLLLCMQCIICSHFAFMLLSLSLCLSLSYDTKRQETLNVYMCVSMYIC